jgi:hypothetical protein
MTAVVVAITCLALPSLASADTGSITNVTDLGDGTIQATYTTNGTCVSDPSPEGYCIWYTYAVQGPAEQACYEYATNDGRLTYVGPEVYTGPATESGTSVFYPKWASARLCLYMKYSASASSTVSVLVGQTVYTPPTTSPTPQPEVVPPLKVREAKSYVPSVLKQKFKSKYSRATLKRSCYRWTTQKVRCDVSWRKAKYKYRGYVMLWNDPADPANSFMYKIKVKHKRIAHHHHGSGGGGGSNCDPNYSGCLNPNASDYDCAGGSGNGPYYTGKVYVYGNDRFDLDRDGDGVACDSASASSAAISPRDQVAHERSAMSADRLGRGTRTWR